MAMLDFLSLRKQVSDLGEDIRNRRRELEGLRRERDLIAAAPLSREDTVNALYARIDREAASHLKKFTGVLRQLVGKGCPTRIEVPILGAENPGFAPSIATLEAGIGLLFADQFKASVGGIVAAMDWPSGALDYADKQNRLAGLDSKIGKIETDLTALVRNARSAGLNV